jgi:hypothetical protein
VPSSTHLRFFHDVCFPFGFLDRNFVCNSHIITLILFSLVHTKYDSQIIQFSFSSDLRLSRDQVSHPYINYMSDYTGNPTATSPQYGTCRGNLRPYDTCSRREFWPSIFPLRFKLTYVAARLRSAVIHLLRWPGAFKKKNLSKCGETRVFNYQELYENCTQIPPIKVDCSAFPILIIP